MLKPSGDRVVLKAGTEEEKTVGGIVLASNVKEKPTTGKVVAVGEGRTLEDGQELAPAVKEGDRVLSDKYAGNEVEYNGEKSLAVHAKNLAAIVE